MAEISIVKAFLQAGEMLTSGNSRKATEATRFIIDNLERTKNNKEINRTITLSRNDKKMFSY